MNIALLAVSSAGRGRLRRLAAMLAFVLLSCLAAVDARAQVSCEVTSGAPNLAFGNVDLIDGSGPAEVSATMDIECRNTSLSSVRVQVCLNIGDGSGGIGSFNPRKMSNVLLFQIYQDGGSTIWGSTSNPSLPTPWRWNATIPARPVLGSYGSVRGSATMTGRLVANQGTVAPGSYQNSFAGMHTAITFATGGADCGTTRQGSFAFVASATVIKSCVVSADALNFGQADGLPVSTNIAGQTQVRVKCSPGTAYAVALTSQNNSGSTSGAGLMRSAASADTVPYQLFKDAARSQVWGNASTNGVTGAGTGIDQPLTIYGRVPSANVTPGVYTDTVVVRVTY